MPLGPQQAEEKFAVGKALLLSQSEGLVEDFGDGSQMQAAQQLIELVAHDGWSPSKRKKSVAILRRTMVSTRSRSKRPYCWASAKAARRGALGKSPIMCSIFRKAMVGCFF